MGKVNSNPFQQVLCGTISELSITGTEQIPMTILTFDQENETFWELPSGKQKCPSWGNYSSFTLNTHSQYEGGFMLEENHLF